MNFIISFVVIVIIHCSIAIPKLKDVEAKITQEKPEVGLADEIEKHKGDATIINKVTPQEKKSDINIPKEKSKILKNFATLKPKGLLEKLADKIPNIKDKTKPLFGVDYGYFDSSSSGETLEHEMHMFVPIPKSLSSVDWNCMAQVVKNFIRCLAPSNPMVEEFTEAYTADDLFKQGFTTVACVIQISVGLPHCVDLTDTIPDFMEYYDSTEMLRKHHK